MAIKRMPTVRFVEQLVAALERKDGYILTAYGQNPRTGYLDLSVPESKCKPEWKVTGHMYNQYKDKPKQYEMALANRKRCVRVWDCNGLAEGIYELYSGKNINKKSWYNYLHWCKPKGAGMIPANKRVPGAAIFFATDPKKPRTIHHTAYLYKPVVDGKPDGDWYFIECTSGNTMGVRTDTLYKRKPNYWGWMSKYYDYRNAVKITGSTNVRSAPGATGTTVIGVAHKGDVFQYTGYTQRVSGRDWYKILYQGKPAWVSSKYSKLITK